MDHLAPYDAQLSALVDRGILRPLDRRFALMLAELDPALQGAEGELVWPVLLGAALASTAIFRGHICADLAHVESWLVGDDHDEEGVSLGEGGQEGASFPPLEQWLEALSRSALVSEGGPTPLVLRQARLYLHRYDDYEQRLAAELLKRRDRLVDIGGAGGGRGEAERLRGVLDGLFVASPTFQADPDQQRAAEVATSSAFTIISGGPGTGKTSTVIRILAAVFATQPKTRALLLAPTGKAAQRLAESIREQRDQIGALGSRIPTHAMTIHRALGFQPHNPTRFAHTQGNPLPADLIIVDEASMIDLALMTKLMEATSADARLVLLGDKDQLASVAAGHVLGELAQASQEDESLRESFVTLTHSHRFEALGPIGQLAEAVNAGDSERALALLGEAAPGGPLEWIESEDTQSLRETAIQGWSPLFRHLHDPAKALGVLDGFQLLTAHRRGRWGAEVLGEHIPRWLHESHHIEGRRLWYPGRPIMILANDPIQDLWNGDTGLVLTDRDGRLRAFFPSSQHEGGIRSVPLAQLPPHRDFYATTIHKAQGSSFDHVVVALPPRHSPLLSRELLYTAITRARQRVTIVSTRSSLTTAISNQVHRSSGLLHALRASALP